MTHPVSDEAIRRFFRAQVSGLPMEDYPPDPWAIDPVQRTRELFRTSRRYGVDKKKARHHWETTLSPILQGLGAIPVTLTGYDAWLEKKVWEFSRERKVNLGLAQKVLNLLMKDQWGWAKLPSQMEPVLHVPVDRIVLSKLNKPPKQWESWTKVNVRELKTFKCRWTEYLAIQTAYRQQARRLGFRSVLAMEQIIWGRFDIPQPTEIQ